MKREILERDAIGKTIEGFVYSSSQMIVYFDQAFTTFGVLNGEEIVSEKLKGFSEDLVRAGILSMEELEKKWVEKDGRWHSAREAHDRLRYEELKARFEPN